MAEEAHQLIYGDAVSKLTINQNQDFDLTAQRVARREARRIENTAKKKIREISRLQKTLSCDARAHVRIAASEALHGASTVEGTHDSEAVCEKLDASDETMGPTAASLCSLELDTFSLELLPQSWTCLKSLDLSYNNLTDVPGIEELQLLEELDLRRNSFRNLPCTLRKLPKLTKLNASRNELRPNGVTMLLLQAPGLPALQELDITFNKKCFTRDLADTLTTGLPTVSVRVTVTFPPPEGAYIGEAPSTRDASLLRSQLEPYTTLQLRQRLVDAFDQPPHSVFGAPPFEITEPRAEVMQRVLDCYAAAGSSERKLVRVNGIPMDPVVVAELEAEVRAWARR